MIGIHERDLPAFGNNWWLFFLLGIVLLVLGFGAMSAATFTTLLTVVILGFIILISGIVIAIDTLIFWRRKWSGFFMHLLLSILYIAAGVILIKNPLEGSVSLTFILGIFYLIMGVFRVGTFTALRAPRWGWGWLNGFISMILGILILVNWPASSLYLLGIFVGIDLVFCGWTYIMLAFAGRRLNKL